MGTKFERGDIVRIVHSPCSCSVCGNHAVGIVERVRYRDSRVIDDLVINFVGYPHAQQQIAGDIELEKIGHITEMSESLAD